MPKKFENGRKFDGKRTLCKTLMAKKCICTPRIDQSGSKRVERGSVFTILECLHGAVSKCVGQSSVFKIYRFRNLPVKNVLFSCEREAYSSRHIFHLYQNVPAL